MTWKIESVDPRDDASWIHASWTGSEPVYGAALSGAVGVDRTTHRSAQRDELHCRDEPLKAVFRWRPCETADPRAVLTWRTQPDGPEQSETISLGHGSPAASRAARRRIASV